MAEGIGHETEVWVGLPLSPNDFGQVVHTRDFVTKLFNFVPVKGQ